tara:strand:+ start:1717 stop:1899 length:183 start_codon:yes stop_codon:yes gene_type:complete
MAKLKSFLTELEDEGSINYDEQQRRFIGLGGQCPTTQGQPHGGGGKPANKFQKDRGTDEG